MALTATQESGVNVPSDLGCLVGKLVAVESLASEGLASAARAQTNLDINGFMQEVLT